LGLEHFNADCTEDVSILRPIFLLKQTGVARTALSLSKKIRPFRSRSMSILVAAWIMVLRCKTVNKLTPKRFSVWNSAGAAGALELAWA
jgi:hypothetical protein